MSYDDVELGSARSGLLLLGGTAANLTISNLKLPMTTTTYVLVLNAHWDGALGGSSKEDSRAVQIQSVGVVFCIDYGPRTVESTKSFNLTFHVL